MTSNRQTLRITFDQLIRNDRAQLLAILIQKINDIELAEDALQEALTQAWSKWQLTGVPENPKSWLLKTAYNKAIDFIRRQHSFNNKKQQISQLLELQHELNINTTDELIPDERLKLIFVCCHPALDQISQVALTLNTVCGLTTEQVANSLLLRTTTMAQRLVRAKRKIKLSGIPYQRPEKSSLASKLEGVLKVIYLIYNQGYYSAENKSLIKIDYTKEAIHLTLLLNLLIPNQAEIWGLLALMYFHLARFKARAQSQNLFISLEQQNRGLWDQQLIDTANNCFKQAMNLKSMGPYQIQAAISGVHSEAKSFKDTNWQQIVLLYNKLYEYLPIATVKINQAVAMAYNNQSKEAWELLQSIEQRKLDNYLPYYLACAHVLKTLGKLNKAINSFSQAMALSKNPQEKAFLQTQIDLISH